MYKLQRLLLIILATLFTTSVVAQTNVSVEVKGIEGDVAKNVLLFLSIEQQKSHPLLSEARLRRLHQKAPVEISQALEPFGYYNPEINGQLIGLNDNQWRAVYTIEPGSPIPLTKFDFVVTGELLTDNKFLLFKRNLPLQEGHSFNHLSYESIKSELIRLAAERGYLDAHLTKHKVAIDLNAYEVYVALHFYSGERYKFGEITVHQQDALEPQLLQRYFPIKQGTPYSFNKLIELQQALNDSDYFSIAEVSPGMAQSDKKEVPITVSLTPRKRHRYTLGLGYGTDTGTRTKLGWEIPRLNRRGHRLNTELKLSQIGFSLSSHYQIPILNPRTDQLVFSAGVINEETDTSESTIRTISASINHGRGAWRESLSINYQQEVFTIADTHDRATLLMPGIKWSRTWGNDFIHTIDGLRFDIGLRGANEHFISDTNFAQIQGGVKAIRPLGQRNRVIARGRLGGTLTNEFEKLPSSVRFFAGGAQSVRGYRYQSLGPVDSSGKVIGGKHLMIGSIELEHKLNGKWGAAVFYDGGNAIDDIADKLERGSGFGIRWQSPVGPVRFDLAFAISEDNNPWRIHINIGPDL